MAMLQEEILLKFLARLDGCAEAKPIQAVTPAWEPAYPGTPEKMEILRERVAKKLPVHHPQDVKLPLGEGWRIRVGPNGRIIHKQRVTQDKAGIVIVAEKLTADILKEIEIEFGPRHFPILGCEPPKPPPPVTRRAA